MALKQRAAYHAGGKLNMQEVQGTKKQEEKLVEMAEKEGKELTEKELEVFRLELLKKMSNPDQPIDPASLANMHQKAHASMLKATGNAKLA